MNFFRTFWRKRANRKLYRDVVASVRHTLIEDDDILTDEQKTRLDGFIRAADEAKSNPDLEQSAEALNAVSRDYASFSGRSTFRAWMASVLDVLAVAFGVAFGVRALFLQPFQIPTSSMQPTLFGIHYIDREASAPYRSPVVKFFTPLGASEAKLVSPRDNAFIESKPVPFSRSLISQIPSLLHPGRFYLTASNIRFGGRDFTVPGSDPSENIFRYLPEDPTVTPESLAESRPTPRLYAEGETVFDGWVSSGDHLFVDRVSIHFKPLKRGEVFVFNTEGLYMQESDGRGGVCNVPLPGYYYIKRLAGLPGDTLRIRNDHLYIRPKGETEFRPAEDFNPAFAKLYSSQGGYQGHQAMGFLKDGEFTLPDGFCFALGDNTANSLDSRYWGPLPVKNIIGRALFVFWPISRRLGPVDRRDPLPVPTELPDERKSRSTQPTAMRLQ